MGTKARSSTEVVMPKKLRYNYYENHDDDDSPDDRIKSKIWNIEETPKKCNYYSKGRRASIDFGKVVVIYYISSPTGQLQHPHFMEVPLSSSHALYLKDVMNRLNFLRGDGMANMYSWSSKRSYKNGYVWQDLSENDVILPTNGKDEYVIKGSELLQSSSSFRACETAASRNQPEIKDSGADTTVPPAPVKRRNQSWSSFDNPPQEYKVYKCESSRGFAGVPAADAGTQTGEKRREMKIEEHDNSVAELSREDISPPASHCSSEVFDGMSGIIDVDRDCGIGDRTVKHLSGRMKVSKVLMQFIRCGSGATKALNSMKNRGV